MPFEIPLWLIALIILIKTLILVKAHRRMSWPLRLSMAIPSVGLALTYLIIWFFPVDTEFQRYFGRNALAWLFAWHAVLLYITRKEHNHAHI